MFGSFKLNCGLSAGELELKAPDKLDKRYPGGQAQAVLQSVLGIQVLKYASSFGEIVLLHARCSGMLWSWLRGSWCRCCRCLGIG